MKDYIDLGIECNMPGCDEEKHYPQLDVKGIKVPKGGEDGYIKAEVILKKKRYDFEDEVCTFCVEKIKFEEVVESDDGMSDYGEEFDKALEVVIAKVGK